MLVSRALRIEEGTLQRALPVITGAINYNNMYGSDRLARLEVYLGLGLSGTIIRRPEHSGVIYEDPCNDPGRELSIVFTREHRTPYTS